MRTPSCQGLGATVIFVLHSDSALVVTWCLLPVSICNPFSSTIPSPELADITNLFTADFLWKQTQIGQGTDAPCEFQLQEPT